MSVIKGVDAILYWKCNGFFRPIACMEECNVTTNTELSETSTVSTGIFRTYRGNRNTWTVSARGLCSFDTNHPHVTLRLLQKSFTPIPIQFTAIDENGLTETFTGTVLITTLPTDSAANDFYTYSIEATGTGDYQITDIPVDPNENCQDTWVYYNANGTEGNTFALDALKNISVSGRLYRDGIEFRPSGDKHDGRGAPIGKQFKHDPVEGRITFDPTLEGLAFGEQVDIPINYCGSINPLTCDIIITNVTPSIYNNGGSTLEIATILNPGSRFSFALKGTPVAGDVVTVNYSVNLNDVDPPVAYSVTSTVIDGWGLGDLVNDLYDQMFALNENTVHYVDPGGNPGVTAKGFDYALGDVTLSIIEGVYKFKITFEPVIDGVVTVPDSIKVRYSSDNGETWLIPDSFTYNPDDAYNIVIIDDELDIDQNYLFEITPVCNDQDGTPGTGSFAACLPVTWTNGTPVLPDGQVDVPYNTAYGLSGNAPFTLTDVVKPSWMTIQILFTGGSYQVFFLGTPDTEATGITVSFKITNCIDGELNFSDTIDIETIAQNGTITNNRTDFVVQDVIFDGVPSTPYIDFPVATGGGIGQFTLPIGPAHTSNIVVRFAGMPSAPLNLQVKVNGSIIETKTELMSTDFVISSNNPYIIHSGDTVELLVY